MGHEIRNAVCVYNVQNAFFPIYTFNEFSVYQL